MKKTMNKPLGFIAFTLLLLPTLGFTNMYSMQGEFDPHSWGNEQIKRSQEAHKKYIKKRYEQQQAAERRAKQKQAPQGFYQQRQQRDAKNPWLEQNRWDPNYQPPKKQQSPQAQQQPQQPTNQQHNQQNFNQPNQAPNIFGPANARPQDSSLFN